MAKKPKIRIKLTQKQLEHVMDLITDELMYGPPRDNMGYDHKTLRKALGHMNKAMVRFGVKTVEDVAKRAA